MEAATTGLNPGTAVIMPTPCLPVEDTRVHRRGLNTGAGAAPGAPAVSTFPPAGITVAGAEVDTAEAEAEAEVSRAAEVVDTAAGAIAKTAAQPRRLTGALKP